MDEIADFWSDYAHPDGHHALNVIIESEEPDGTVQVGTKGFFARPAGSTAAITTTSSARLRTAGASSAVLTLRGGKSTPRRV